MPRQFDFKAHTSDSPKKRSYRNYQTEFKHAADQCTNRNSLQRNIDARFNNGYDRIQIDR